MAIISGGKKYNSFAELEAEIMGRSAQVAPKPPPPKPTAIPTSVPEKRPTPQVQAQAGWQTVQNLGKNLPSMIGAAIGRIGQDGEGVPASSPKAGAAPVTREGPSWITKYLDPAQARKEEAQLANQQRAIEEEKQRALRVEGYKQEQQALQRTAGQELDRLDDLEDDRLYYQQQTPKVATTYQTAPSGEPRISTTQREVPATTRRSLEEEMLQSTDEDFLDQDLYGDYGVSMATSGAYTTAVEAIKIAVQNRMKTTNETKEDAGRALLEQTVTVKDPDGRERKISANQALNEAYQAQVTEDTKKTAEVITKDEDGADAKKDAINDEGANAEGQDFKLLGGGDFKWDPTSSDQPVTMDFTGANENYLKGKDAHTRLKNTILEAYANGSFFIVPGNEDTGTDPRAIRIDSRNQLQKVIAQTLAVNGLDPNEAMKAARQSIMNWEASINQIESRHRENAYFNENFFDATAETPPTIEGEEPLPEIPQDWTGEMTDVDSPWWETFDETAATEAEIRAQVTAEGGPEKSTVEKRSADYFANFANIWTPSLEGLAKTAGSSDPTDPLSFNPFRGDPRPGFDAKGGIDKYGMPENLNEAVYATSWINNQRAIDTPGGVAGVMQVIDELGVPKWIDTKGPGGNILGQFSEATPAQLSKLEHMNQVQDSVDAIYKYDRDFRFTQGQTKLDEYMMNAETKIANEHDIEMRDARTDADVLAATTAYDRKVEMIKQELVDATEVIQIEQDFEQAKIEADYQFRGWVETNKVEQQQNAMMLDAAMKKYDIDEASRQAQASESLRFTELKIQQAQMQFDLFKSLTSDPQMMFFMKQGGILSMFEDILGSQGSLAQITTNYTNRISGHPIFKGVGEVPNIQEMAKKRPDEMQAAFFGAQTMTGRSMEDVAATMKGGAPYEIRAQRPSRQIALV